jgi:uncharacterized protein (DUF1499 family)
VSQLIWRGKPQALRDCDRSTFLGRSHAFGSEASTGRIVSMTVFSKGKRRGLGVVAGRLADCPDTPNCVCTDAADPEQRVEAFPLAIAPVEAWHAIRVAVTELPRTRIVKLTADYLHAECRSQWLGFVDDLELHLRETHGATVVAVRSAARLGYWDFGVNRARVEELRRDLVKRGIAA